jgi:hypothetical protein
MRSSVVRVGLSREELIALAQALVERTAVLAKDNAALRERVGGWRLLTLQSCCDQPEITEVVLQRP